VPERRQERTTEGGLDVVEGLTHIKACTKRLQDENVRVSLFIATDYAQIEAAKSCNADIVEFHTGLLCESFHAQKKDDFNLHLSRLKQSCKWAHDLGLEVHAGHGID
jgi:pyridoxine 5-phosphate synthase